MALVLVTGGCGFIGSHFIERLLAHHAGARVLNLDKLTYAGNRKNLEAVAGDPRYQLVHGDIADRSLLRELFARGLDTVFHFAAESHVDRSIADSSPFLHTNVAGTHALLEAAREHGVRRFLHVSTDEVYGDIPAGSFACERTLLAPSNPYAASKAAADLLVLSYVRTHQLPALVTRCANNYGPRQYPEKMLPLFIRRILCGELVPLYGDGLNTRDWIHVRDHCAALEGLWQAGRPGEIYNIGAGNERTNLDLTHLLLKILKQPPDLIRFVTDRPGHDRRYALDCGKIKKELGWRPQVPFEEGLPQTVRWYVEHAKAEMATPSPQVSLS